MEKYLRTFIGLPLRVEPVFLEARRDLMRALEGERISWTNPDQYHVTLRFIGDTEHSSIREDWKCTACRSDCCPSGLSWRWEGLGSFGPRKRPRVIWTGFDRKRIV